ncbi:MAG: hypothetical protein ABIO04_08865 [Ferruginibacter sp.]
MDKHLISHKQSKLPMLSFTPEDLLQYLYKETSPEKTAAIKAALESDWSLREKFEVISASSKKLEEIKLSPRNKTIDYIINYAEKAIEEVSHHA